MNTFRRWGALALVVAVVGAFTIIGAATAGCGDIRVSLGQFVVPIGARLAVELTPSESIDPQPVVLSWSMMDGEGTPLAGETYPESVDVGVWLGQFTLADEGGASLPVGDYSIEIRTSVGAFIVTVQVVDVAPSGVCALSATAGGLSLDVYRLVTEADAGRTIDLRVGDRLMVVLDGNPTTGYQWTSALLDEYAVLHPLAEPEYRAASTGLLGSGGVFVFRYTAADVGPQAFRFVYQRPWETTDSDLEFAFDVIVR